MIKKIFFIVFSLSLLLSACKTFDSRNKQNINGMVYDFSNRPVSNYTVSINEKNVSVTDINGRFLLPQVPPGEYAINGKGNGYEPYQGSITINGPGQIVYIRVPTVKQLIGLADTALANNRLQEADSYLSRAYSIGIPSTELLFYRATVKFRQKDYGAALEILESAVDSGLQDEYVEKFIGDIKRIKNEY